MDFTVLTLFPDLLSAFFNHGMMARGMDKQLISGKSVNIRDFAFDRHHTVDDRPYGGGSGMVMKPDILEAAVLAAKQQQPDARVVLMSPQGQVFTQQMAHKMAKNDHGLIFICGRYEGIDERVYAALVDLELSIGDYVMTGGELAAMVIMDSVTRLIPGVLGSCESSRSDSFSGHRLEYAQYTRPETFHNQHVPDILLSGNHEKIQKWRKRSALQRTFLKRPDLFDQHPLDDEEKQIVKQWCRELSDIVNK